MKHKKNCSGASMTNRLCVFLLCLLLILPAVGHAEGCRTGAEAIANAYVRMNPIVSLYFGGIENYVEQNRSHFVSGGDAVVCAAQMANALFRGAIQSYDPDFHRQRDELNARIGAMGLSPAQPHASPSAQMYSMARRLKKLADTLPYAANGNYGPLWTPRDETEQMEIFAMQMLRSMLHDPEVRASLSYVEPQIKELANVEYRIILEMARGL
jgi:hypothetical protein